MMEWLVRFLVGGAVVSFFAMLGDILRPKSFAGLFGAAPSVALATMALALHAEGKSYTAREAETMLLGAAGFLVYAVLSSRVLRSGRVSALKTSLGLLPVWAAVSVGLWALIFWRP